MAWPFARADWIRRVGLEIVENLLAPHCPCNAVPIGGCTQQLQKMAITTTDVDGSTATSRSSAPKSPTDMSSMCATASTDSTYRRGSHAGPQTVRPTGTRTRST